MPTAAADWCERPVHVHDADGNDAVLGTCCLISGHDGRCALGRDMIEALRERIDEMERAAHARWAAPLCGKAVHLDSNHPDTCALPANHDEPCALHRTRIEAHVRDLRGMLASLDRHR